MRAGLLLEALATMRPVYAFAWFFLANLVVCVASVAVGNALTARFASRRVVPEPPPVAVRQVVLAASCVVLNTAVSLAGWHLWRVGSIVVRDPTWSRVVVDVVVLTLVMDLLMYVFHALAHVGCIYRLVHGIHHVYDRPRPLDLFVLNPAEVLGFGALWIAVLLVYSATLPGILTFLTLNVVMGTLGHLGVEPFPSSWSENRVLALVGSSTFHARHHRDPRVNLGFYTGIWDRLFGTRWKDARR